MHRNIVVEERYSFFILYLHLYIFNYFNWCICFRTRSNNLSIHACNGCWVNDTTAGTAYCCLTLCLTTMHSFLSSFHLSLPQWLLAHSGAARLDIYTEAFAFEVKHKLLPHKCVRVCGVCVCIQRYNICHGIFLKLVCYELFYVCLSVCLGPGENNSNVVMVMANAHIVVEVELLN